MPFRVCFPARISCGLDPRDTPVYVRANGEKEKVSVRNCCIPRAHPRDDN